MDSPVRTAFEQRILSLPLHSIQVRKAVPDSLKRTRKYRRIAKSIAEIGIVEPLVVAPPSRDNGSKYLLLDGHMRFQALLDLGAKNTHCLVSHDDEAFTYNKRINRLARLQEHFMIVRALERGVPESKLASALDVKVGFIRRRQAMQNELCAEVIALLGDKPVKLSTFDVLCRMKPARQVDAARAMISAANFSTSYARVLLVATNPTDLATRPSRRRIPGLSLEQAAHIRHEMEFVQKDFKAMEPTYGGNVLELVIASRYISKLIGNNQVKRYLEKNCPDVLKEFRAIASSVSLESSSD